MDKSTANTTGHDPRKPKSCGFTAGVDEMAGAVKGALVGAMARVRKKAGVWGKAGVVEMEEVREVVGVVKNARMGKMARVGEMNGQAGKTGEVKHGIELICEEEMKEYHREKTVKKKNERKEKRLKAEEWKNANDDEGLELEEEKDEKEM